MYDFTICIPSFNRKEKLRCLLISISDAIARLNKNDLNNSKILTLVCLDGSTDGSCDMIETLKEHFICDLEYFWQSNSGLASARNALVINSNCRYIWFLDDDMIVSEKSVFAHVCCERIKQELLVGPCYTESSSKVNKFYNKRWKSIMESGGYVLQPQHMSYANTSGERALFCRYLFNSTFKGYGFEDYELAIRMLEDSIQIRFEESAGVIHCYERGNFKLLKNVREEGVNRVRLTQLHPESGKFALVFAATGCRPALVFFSNLGWHRVLYFGAMIFVLFASLSVPFISEPLKRLARNMALHSGIARENGVSTLE